jgi:hypothetical protein
MEGGVGYCAGDRVAGEAGVEEVRVRQRPWLTGTVSRSAGLAAVAQNRGSTEKLLAGGRRVAQRRDGGAPGRQSSGEEGEAGLGLGAQSGEEGEAGVGPDAQRFWGSSDSSVQGRWEEGELVQVGRFFWWIGVRE